MKLALLATISVLLYVGAYFAVLALPAGFQLRPAPGLQVKFAMINGEVLPNYHGIPEVVFAPLHFVDAHYLRRARWFTPKDAPMDFNWLQGTSPH